MNKNNISTRIAFFLIGAIISLLPIKSNAFSLSTYSENSVLSEGKWVKVSIPKSGIYMISNADLQSWGFSDPSKVNIYGYGGKRLPDVLSISTFIDDLPIVQSHKTNRGIVFYAQGPETWSSPVENQYVHSLNPFSTVGYYFVSDRETTLSSEIPTKGKDIDPSSLNEAATSFTEAIFHETDLVNHGETGHLLLGEDFRYSQSQTYKFSLTDILTDNDVWLECSFATKTTSAASMLHFTANGEPVESSPADRIAQSAPTGYIHGQISTTRHRFNISNSELSLGIKISSNATLQMANLNYITLNYTRKLKLHNGILKFRSTTPLMSLSGIGSSTHIWDITSPQNIYSLKTSTSGDVASFNNSHSGLRDYIAWDETTTLPSPSFVSKISNQNLHGIETPDMVIFTISDWASQAERIAELHRNSSDSLKVLVVDQELVFNEFASGAPDVNAFRKFLKMLWDRSNNTSTPIRYALFFGRGTFDNRHLTNELKNSNEKTIPMWQTDKGLDDNDSYCSDDIHAFLKDNSGANMGADHYCIAVGRIPARSYSDAKDIVDKLYHYTQNSTKSEWKNQVMLVADDMDNGIHMDQSETMWQIMSNTPSGKEFVYNKLYIDAFTREGNSYPQAKSKMFKLLDEGTLWWNYIGHANTTSWTHDGLLSYVEMSSLYLKRFPFLYAATCDYLRWDATSSTGAEIMYKLSDGGIIGAISATRPVYIANNGLLSNALAQFLFKRNEEGQFLTIGEIYQNAKNNLSNNGIKVQDRNKLRFALMGDPAMRLAIPQSVAKVNSINGSYTEFGEQAIIQARQNAIIQGRITNDKGLDISDFTGIIHSTLYDADKSTTSHGYTHDDDGKEVAFDEHGEKLYAGRDSVVNGEFTINISMPTEIANNFREATLNLYAIADNGKEAIGCDHSFYVYGFDESTEADTIAPIIEYLYINHEDFANGDIVNESPMLIAQISDNVSINLSSAGVGHQMSIRLDGDKHFSDVSQYYTPIISDMSRGVINYPIKDLPNGDHALRLKVWDTSGNSTEKDINIKVINGFVPNIFDVYTDANPAHTEVNFYIKHDRPDAMATIKVEVFDLMGKLVWQSTRSGQSDMSTSTPINWDLCDMSGRRVNRGIYVYKASMSTNGQDYSSSSRKLAVAAK